VFRQHRAISVSVGRNKEEFLKHRGTEITEEDEMKHETLLSLCLRASVFQISSFPAFPMTPAFQ